MFQNGMVNEPNVSFCSKAHGGKTVRCGEGLGVVLRREVAKLRSFGPQNQRPSLRFAQGEQDDILGVGRLDAAAKAQECRKAGIAADH